MIKFYTFSVFIIFHFILLINLGLMAMNHSEEDKRREEEIAGESNISKDSFDVINGDKNRSNRAVLKILCCPKCKKQFLREDSRQKHIDTYHTGQEKRKESDDQNEDQLAKALLPHEAHTKKRKRDTATDEEYQRPAKKRAEESVDKLVKDLCQLNPQLGPVRLAELMGITYNISVSSNTIKQWLSVWGLGNKKDRFAWSESLAKDDATKLIIQNKSTEKVRKIPQRTIARILELAHEISDRSSVKIKERLRAEGLKCETPTILSILKENNLFNKNIGPRIRLEDEDRDCLKEYQEEHPEKTGQEIAEDFELPSHVINRVLKKESKTPPITRQFHKIPEELKERIRELKAKNITVLKIKEMLGEEGIKLHENTIYKIK